MKERDELFNKIAKWIIENKQTSIAAVQRHFVLGYNRAGRIFDQLEEAKIIGPFQGTKQRELYINNINDLEKFLNQ